MRASLSLVNQSVSRTASVISLLVGAVMISFSAPLVRLADVAPSVSGFYRVFFGAIILMVWLGVSKGISWRRGWPGSVLLGLFFALDLWFWHRSIIYVSPGISTLLANLQVLAMGAVGVWWFKEPAGWRFAGGVIRTASSCVSSTRRCVSTRLQSTGRRVTASDWLPPETRRSRPARIVTLRTA